MNNYNHCFKHETLLLEMALGRQYSIIATRNADEALRYLENGSVDAIISIDARGQLVLPKDLREKAHIEAGNKFTVISWQSDGKVCCISLIKADDFADTVKSMLGPMIGEIAKK